MLRNIERAFPNVPKRQKEAAFCLPHLALGVEGRGKDGIWLVRASQGPEHAQLGCFLGLSLSLLPQAKRPASEKDA